MDTLMSYFEQLIANEFIAEILLAILLVLITALLSRFCGNLVQRMLNREGNPLPSSTIFINIVRITIWAIGICVILDTCFSVNASALITALGIGGLAISLGFQDTISNLIGGLQLSLIGLIQPGDNIEVGGKSGVVKDMTWRHTTVIDPTGEEIVIPNSVINKTSLVHLPAPDQVMVPFTVTSSRDLDQLSLDLERIAIAAAEKVTKLETFPAVQFLEITDLGIKGRIVFKVVGDTKPDIVIDAVIRMIAEKAHARG